MNPNLIMQSQDHISSLKFSEQATFYNFIAAELDLKPIKKFRDKSTGVKRIIAIQIQYTDAVNAIIDTVVDKVFAEDLEDAKLIEQAADKVFDKAYVIGTVKPKSESSAMGIIYKFVEECGSVSLEGLCEHFLSEYSLQYKGKAELNTSFAKGYIKGAVRASNITTV